MMDASTSNDPFAGGANPFAAIGFDGNAAPVSPATSPDPTPDARSPSSEGSSAAAHPSPAPDPFAGDANPFAAIGFQADTPKPAPPADPGVLANSADDSFASGTLKNIGTSAIKGVAHAPGFFGDLTNLAGALGEIPDYVEAKIRGIPRADVTAQRLAAGAKVNAASEDFSKATLGFSVDPRHYLPSGSEVAAPILQQTGAYEPTTTAGRYGSAAVESTIGAFGPGGGNAIGGVLRHAVPNAVAGLSSQAASDATGGDALAASLAGIGAGGALGAAHGAYTSAPARRAASVLSKATSDPQGALDTIAQGQADALPGVAPTTAELTGDKGLYGLQSSAADNNPLFDARRAQQDQGRLAALDQLSPNADPGRVATFFGQHFDDIGDRAQAEVDGHLADAQAQADALRGRGLPVDAYGASLRSSIADVYATRKAAQNQLHDLVDPDGTLTADLSDVKGAASQIYGPDLPAATRARLSPDEQVFPNVIAGFGNVESYRQLAALKSELADAMRGELSDNGSSPAYRRMSMLMGPVQSAINGSVVQRSTADNASVAAGTMAPENTLAAQLRGVTSDYLADQGNARSNAGEGVAATGTGDAAGIPPVLGASSQGNGQSRVPPRPQAVPGDVAGGAPQIGSSAPGAVRPAYYPGGALGVRNELVEHGDLLTSHDADFRANPDYPQNLQPRARDSVGARDQVNGMAARLQPERLGPSPEANGGAPIVGPDNVVESGNGRTLAIGKAYDAGQGDAYRQHLESLGYDTSGFDKPVLVARRVTPMSPDQREFFTHAANDATSLRMGSAEQAAADAKRITPAMLDAQSGSNIAAAGNKPFVSAFMSTMPAAERGALVDQGGGLSQAGVRRIQAAMTAHAYGDQGVVSRAFDDPEPNIKGLAGALTDASGPWAKMRAAVADGTIALEHDVTPELMQGVKLAMRARDEGRPISEMLNQGDLFNSDTSRLVTGMLTSDGNRLAPRPRIEANLRSYADEAMKNVSGDRLFGDGAAPVGDVLKASQAKAARESGGDSSTSPAAPVFSDVPPPPTAPTATMDAGAAARYQAANAASKDLAATYGAKPIADVMAESGGRGNYKMPASAVPGQLFPKGPGGYEAVQAFRKSVGDDQASMHILRDHALDDLQRTARSPDGTLDPKKLERWQSVHSEALRAYPELGDQFRDAAAATRTLEEASGQRRDLIKAYQKSVFGKLMNASHPDEVNGIVGAALNRPDRVSVFRRLAKETSADPMASAGLQQSVLDHIVGRSVADIQTSTGPQRTIKSNQFRDLVTRTRPALEEVLGSRSTGMLQRISESLPRASHAVEQAGKNHADVMRYLKAATKPHESLLERMVKLAFVAREVGEAAGGDHGGMIAAGTAAAALIGKKTLDAMRSTGARKVGDLINDALLNPEQYAALMAQAPLKPDTGSASTLAFQLRRASMYGGDAMTRVTNHLATRAPRLADRADDERRRQQPDDRSARARGGGLFGGGGGLLGGNIGGGPLGVPTYAQMTGPGMKAAKAPFAGGSVNQDSVEERTRSFMADLQATSAALKVRSKEDALIASFGPRDLVAEAIAVAGGRNERG